MDLALSLAVKIWQHRCLAMHSAWTPFGQEITLTFDAPPQPQTKGVHAGPGESYTP